ncbi:LemA family protein [Anaerosporomusa subterranea]|jgi:LemA protein|uniref:LemA family protein n=1 Tax=Anaerosporomusa subterranea TaxID=1794912 RepID=A0A154BRJ9_ANASB|nr:LemA family protein [Anaerosporomusa subterranea]KYZ76529.1 LemA family protein [Anaerosporomusa subterranea]
MNKTTIIILVVVALLAVFGFSSYNGLVGANESVNGKWSQIENQLQRRSDLIPNLVNTVKGFAAQEKEIIQSVADARSKLAGANGPAAKAQANGELNGALSRLLVVVENYPQLKSDANFRQLMDELSGTENRIAVARQDYNNAVQSFNTKIRSFPTNMFAGMMGFGPKEYFKAEEGAKQVPQVKF